MKRKHKRLLFVGIGMALLGVAAALVLGAFRDNLVFFYSPSEIAQKVTSPDQRVRIGGLVEDGSVVKGADGRTITFGVTDLTSTVPVTFSGMLPDLFGEGQGVVCEGYYRDGQFVADNVLAKHDENYMPREVAEALRQSGEWRGDAEAAQ